MMCLGMVVTMTFGAIFMIEVQEKIDRNDYENRNIETRTK